MPRRDQRSASEVDLTPLIDVLFNLIIFLVLAASFDRGLVTVDLPRGETADAAGTSPLTIQVLPEGELRIEEGPATPEEAVRRAREAVRAGRTVQIAGDRRTPYGRVAELMERLRAAGVGSVGLLYRGGTP